MTDTAITIGDRIDMTDNWDTRSAMSCRIPELVPAWCDRCRDKLFCQKIGKFNKQISIEDYLKERKANEEVFT